MNTINIYDKDLETILRYKPEQWFTKFIFNDFRLVITTRVIKAVYKVHIDGDIVNVTCRLFNNGVFSECGFTYAELGERGFDIIETSNDEWVIKAYLLLNKGKYRNSKRNDKRFINECFFGHVACARMAMQYIMNESYKRITIQKESCIEPKVESTGRKETKRYDSRTKQFLLDDIVEYISNNKRNHKIVCECWGVRGHFRHLKNGKVVYISEYLKGKKRDTQQPVENKVYLL